MTPQRLNLDKLDLRALKYLSRKRKCTQSGAVRYAIHAILAAKRDARLLALSRETPPRSHYLTLDGKTQTLGAWARERNISRQTLNYRLRAGWLPAEAVNTPLKLRPSTRVKPGKIKAVAKLRHVAVRLADADRTAIGSIVALWRLPTVQAAIRFAIRGVAMVEGMS